MADDRGPRCDWTLEEVAQVRETFGAAAAPAALDLFAPDDWEELYENMTKEELVSELKRLRRKVVRGQRWDSAEQMGICFDDAYLLGIITDRLTHKWPE